MKILITVFALVIFLGALPQSVRASEAEARAGAFVPAVAAAIVPTGHRTIDQLSSNDFVTPSAAATALRPAMPNGIANGPSAWLRYSRARRSIPPAPTECASSTRSWRVPTEASA